MIIDILSDIFDFFSLVLEFLGVLLESWLESLLSLIDDVVWWFCLRVIIKYGKKYTKTMGYNKTYIALGLYETTFVENPINFAVIRKRNSRIADFVARIVYSNGKRELMQTWYAGCQDYIECQEYDKNLKEYSRFIRWSRDAGIIGYSLKETYNFIEPRRNFKSNPLDYYS